MGLKETVEMKIKEKKPLDKKEDAFFELQKLIKNEGEKAISSEYLLDLMEKHLEWEDLQSAGISPEKLEEAMVEWGVPVRR